MRTIPGGIVHCQLVKLDGSKSPWPVPDVYVKGAGDAERTGLGAISVTDRGLAEYMPLHDEYVPYELVSFTFDGDGLVNQSVNVHPTEPPYSPPIWNGADKISKVDFIGLTAMQTPLKSQEYFLQSLLSFDPIPLTTAILNGLHKAYPTIF